MEGNGSTVVNDGVFLSVAEIVLQDIEDVVKREKKGPLAGISQLLTDKFAPQVVVKKVEKDKDGFGRVSYELKLVLLFGAKIPDVAKRVRQQLTNVTEEMTGYKVDRVDVVVDKIVELKELEEENEKVVITEE